MESPQFYSESELCSVRKAVKEEGGFKVEKLLQSDPTLVNKVNERTGVSMLNMAVSCGNIEAVRVIVKYEADVNHADKIKVTPLSMAVQNNRVDIAEFLIENKANINRGLYFGNTVLYRAVINENVDMVRLLLVNKVNVNQADYSGDTAFHQAVAMNLVDIVNLLIEFNVDVNTKNSDGHTPLQLAVGRDLVEMVSVLLNGGAKVEITTKDLYSEYNIAHHVVVRPSVIGREICVHLWKLNLVGQKVSSAINLEQISDVWEEVISVLQECKTEFEKIEMAEVCEGFYLNTVFAQFTKPYFHLNNEICEKLMNLLNTPEFFLEFPMFGHIIKNVFKDSKSTYLLSRIHLLHLAVQWMSSGRLPECLRDLDDEAKENILRFLSDEDLRGIVEDV